VKTLGKKKVFLLLPLLLPVLCATVAWADLVDPCDAADGPGSYQGLVLPALDYISWDDPPDDTYLCQQSNRRAAAAVYYCPGATEATVAIYSRYGSYASGSGDGLVRGGDEFPLEYQSSTGEVYCDGRRMAYDAALGEFVFLEEEDSPGRLGEYGLSVSCSEDGKDYEKVPCRLLSAEREGPDAYWYEVYQAGLEEGTRYLRLTLTDQSSIEIVGREQRYQFETTGGLSLASVEIIGEEEAAPPSQSEDREPGPSEDLTEWEDGPGDGGEEWDNWDDGDDLDGPGDQDWETGEAELPGTGSLPSYRPGEEEGPEELPWGPDESVSDGPAFPDETEDEETEETASSGGDVSSGGSSSPHTSTPQKTPSKAGQKGQEPSQEDQTPQEEKPLTPERPAPELRWEVPLWRRVLEPDAMSMMIIAMTLVVMGIRVLWEEGGDDRGRSGKKRELREREEQYARYMSYDRYDRYRRTGRRSGNKRKTRPRQDEWDEEEE